MPTIEEIQQAIQDALDAAKEEAATLDRQKQISRALAIAAAEDAADQYIQQNYTAVTNLIAAGRAVIYLDLPPDANDHFENALRKKISYLAKGRASLDNQKTKDNQIVMRLFKE